MNQHRHCHPWVKHHRPVNHPNKSDAFTMVYESILDSSIASDYELRHFFEDMLKLADWRTGIVDRTHDAIARRINLPIDKVKCFIEQLEAPDGDDRSGNEQGRRLVRLDEHRPWGWTIVNYQCYRATRSAEERREYNRVKQAERRARLKGESTATVVTPPAPSHRALTPPPVQQNSPLAARICGWFKRRPSTMWDDKELKKLREVERFNTPEEDLVLLDKFYSAPDSFHRKDVMTLLNNWNAEIDRAKNYQPQTNGHTLPSLPKTRFQITSDIESVNKRIKQIKADAGMTFDGNEWHGSLGADDLATVKKLRQDIKELQKQFDASPP